ncbi:MAG: PLxRFG domain-containing protein [Sulfuricella sp.]
MPSAKYIAKQGKPLVVYHGTSADFDAFSKAKTGGNWRQGEGAFFFTSSQRTASNYATRGEGANVMPAYLSITNPYTQTALDPIDAYDNWIKPERESLEAQGYDGVIVNSADGGGDLYVAFHPNQVKSATGNRGTFDPLDPDIRFSSGAISRAKAAALDQLNQYMKHPGKVSMWDKTVGTMRHLAERNPAFKPVFEAAQRFIDDVSTMANDAAAYAPRLIPRVDSWRDIVGKDRKKPISAADNKAVAAPLFEGTLMWGRDTDGTPMRTDDLAKKYEKLDTQKKARMLVATGKLKESVLKAWQGLPIQQYESAVNTRFQSQILKAGVVWKDSELQSIFGATAEQISLYKEARKAIDRSIDMTTRADMLRALGDEYTDMREQVLEAKSLHDVMLALTDRLQEDARANPDDNDRLSSLNNLVVTRYEKATELMRNGYAPLSRFGKYTVDVVDAEGERQYFGMFETMREANEMAAKMRAEFAGAKVTQGTMSAEAYKLFAGITPESMELFGNMLGLDSEGNEAKDKAFQTYLALAKNNHSALKRLIHRKGIAGYSEDVGRVLASFIYSNARQAAGGLNVGTMENAVQGIPKGEGELKDVAMGLRSYIQDPQEEGQAIRGMLFAQYLGGSIASAMVNMTQPFTVTMPWLSQYSGMAKAGQQLSRAIKDMATKGKQYEAGLAEALKHAEDDGVVSPQEIHQLMAQARGAGALRVGDGTKLGDARAQAANWWERGKVAWGQPFALAEQVNRRSTFIAAYRTAVEQKMPNPAAFAERAVLETQFLYSKSNKPKWARGAIGGTLFTFKTYSVSYLELMQRMWTQGGPEGKRAVGWAIAMLMLVGGAGGLPFMEDAEDLIDGAGQLMGYNVSAAQWRRDMVRDVVGAELGDFLEYGLSGLPGAPIDVSGRLGMSNLIPGTGLFLTKQGRERDLLEVVGPAGDLIGRGFTGAKKALTGDLAGAALEISPLAVRNADKGVDMAISGIYKDTKGYKEIDTTLDEAVAKAIGFQPRAVAQVQEANSFMQRSKSFYVQTSSEIKAQWAQALFNKDDAALERVRERLNDWNENNPEQRITIKMPDIWKRVREMGKDRTQRIADTAPKALRQEMRNMANDS